jgi:hypothetical protein
MALFSPLCQAQVYVNGLNINNLDSISYCQISVIQGFGKVSISVNYGQRYNLWNIRKNTITKANGERLLFNSLTDALNYLDKNGWEYIETITEVFEGKTIGFTHILKRKNKL